jgi:hypothetical protein
MRSRVFANHLSPGCFTESGLQWLIVSRARAHRTAPAFLNALLHFSKLAEPQPHPRLFACINSANLYDFPSPDSDFDLRSAQVQESAEVMTLDEFSKIVEGAHEAAPLDMAAKCRLLRNELCKLPVEEVWRGSSESVADS